MRISNLLPIAAVATLLYSSCNQNGNKTPVAEAKDTIFTTSCYIAVDGTDTARLTLKEYDKKVGGKLVIDFTGKDKNDGTIDGAFKGDTLFVDYDFKIGNKETWYKNPLALLKKDGKLIMGIGKMETTMGKTYFRKDVPIDFEGGRFTFAPIECKKQ